MRTFQQFLNENGYYSVNEAFKSDFIAKFFKLVKPRTLKNPWGTNYNLAFGNVTDDDMIVISSKKQLKDLIGSSVPQNNIVIAIDKNEYSVWYGNTNQNSFTHTYQSEKYKGTLLQSVDKFLAIGGEVRLIDLNQSKNVNASIIQYQRRLNRNDALALFDDAKAKEQMKTILMKRRFDLYKKQPDKVLEDMVDLLESLQDLNAVHSEYSLFIFDRLMETFNSYEDIIDAWENFNVEVMNNPINADMELDTYYNPVKDAFKKLMSFKDDNKFTFSATDIKWAEQNLQQYSSEERAIVDNVLTHYQQINKIIIDLFIGGIKNSAINLFTGSDGTWKSLRSRLKSLRYSGLLPQGGTIESKGVDAFKKAIDNVVELCEKMRKILQNAKL
jgi:hypothetical protein